MSGQQLTHLKVLPRHKPSELRQAFDMFLVVICLARRLSPRTTGFYRWELERAVTFLETQGLTIVSGVTPSHLRAYLITYQERHLSDSSQHAAARSLRAWLNWCVRKELLTASPMAKVRMPRHGSAILPAFTPDDVRAILGACRSVRDTAIVLCLLDSGCRASEFMALNVDDVDMKTGAVTIRQGKGKKYRVAFLGTKALRAWWRSTRERPDARPTDPLWVSDTSGERLTN